MRNRVQLAAYGLVILANAAALRVILSAPLQAPAIVLLLVAAVLVNAWVGGLGPGLLSTLVSGFLLAFIGLPSTSPAPSPAGTLLLPALFTALGAGVSIVCGARGRGATRRQMEARFRALLGTELVGIAFCDREAIREANDAFLALMGYPREALRASGFRWPETAPDSRHLDERRLRELIWDPLAEALSGAGRVFVVPDGMLQLVNFAALPDRDSSYLVESAPPIQLLSAERDVVASAATHRSYRSYRSYTPYPDHYAPHA